MLLEQIQQTNDIKKINPKDYPLLAEEIRQFLIEKISVTGGHLGSNLGAVELTMAMHIALESCRKIRSYGTSGISPTPTSC